MPLYPLFADLNQREVMVVGGGDVATRKVEALLRAGACVEVCAPALSPALAQWSATGRVRHRPSEFEPAWLDDVWLIVAATDDGAFNAHLAREAAARKKLVNVVDDAALSSFQVPVVVDRDPLLVAISSSGAAPMLARRLGRQFETELDPAWGALAALFAHHRDAIRRRFPDLAERRRWYDARIDGDAMTLLRQGDTAGAERALAASLASTDTGVACGSLTLITVPGNDAAQLTLCALRAMHQADHVAVHAGLDEGIVALARRDAARTVLAAWGDDAARALGDAAANGRHVVVLWSDAAPIAALAARAPDAGLAVIECTGRAYRVV